MAAEYARTVVEANATFDRAPEIERVKAVALANSFFDDQLGMEMALFIDHVLKAGFRPIHIEAEVEYRVCRYERFRN